MMSNQPTIAILMATYNGEKYLFEQLDSIVGQSYQNFKLYVCDDCSNDSTVNILQSYQNQFPNKIFVTINKMNVGVVKNFEKLLQNCEEPYIALSDQDDIWIENKLEFELKKIRKVQNSEPALVHSDLIMINSNGDTLHDSFLNFRKIRLDKNKNINKIIGHNGVMGCTTLFNQKLKSCILPFPKSLDVHDYWIALVNEVIGKRFTIKEPLVKYRIHENNTSNNISKLNKKRNIYQRFFNTDTLPFIDLQREKVIVELLNRYNSQLSNKDRKIVIAFLDYLQLCKHPLILYYQLIRYKLIRSDFSYRLKIFIKLLKYHNSEISLYTPSKRIVKNTSNFLYLQYLSYIYIIFRRKGIFYGWGRKKSGLQSIALAKKYNTNFQLLEDGFIRSLGLGIEGSPSFSLIEDDIGIYYDATTPSKLENILNNYDFKNDTSLMQEAKKAMELIKKYHISKYNNAKDIKKDFFTSDKNKEKVLIIAQTAGDASLEYGLGNKFTTKQMIDDAMNENPNASVYIKIHPDVLTGKKKSDIKLDEIPKECVILSEDVNPISLLKHFTKVYTKTSGMGMEALILGLDVVCYGMPYYAGWGLTIEKQVCSRRQRKLSVEEVFAGAYVLYTRYYNPCSQRASDIIDTINTIVKYRNIMQQNSHELFFFGFSRWKRKNVQLFFPSFNQKKIIFCSTLKEAQRRGLNNQSKIYIWGKKPFIEVESYAKEQKTLLLRIEDGFIRSVSLGSDLTKAYSLVVDSRGIYFDPTQESDLEHLLNTYVFDEEMLERSKKLQTYLVTNKISKYNNHQDKKIDLPNLKPSQTIVLVPGQVSDDASIVYGAKGMSNLEQLVKTREAVPNAYIIYKPHPDVLAGNRKGHIETAVAKQYADVVISHVSLDSVLELADEVHTMTSLVGIEALIRGKKVHTYGLPFYAGWGLTHDAEVSPRRVKKRTLDELVAATFILYPRYINPKTNLFCEVEDLLKEIDKEKNRYNNDITYKIFINIRNLVFRKIQLIIRTIA